MLNYYYIQLDIDKHAGTIMGRRLVVVMAGVLPSGGASNLVDQHLQVEGVNLELRRVIVL
jgi:hypothetical protein